MQYSLYLYLKDDFEGSSEKCIGNGFTNLESARAYAIRYFGNIPSSSLRYEIGVHDSDGLICGFVRISNGGYSWFNWSGNRSGTHRLNADGTLIRRKKRKDAKAHPFGL